MSASRFRYGLQPLLLSHQWAYQALERDLSCANAAVDEALAAVRELDEKIAQAHAAQRLALSSLSPMRVESFSGHVRYLADLSRRRAGRVDHLLELQEQRAAVMARTVEASRKVEAVEKHRREKLSEFTKTRLRNEFRSFDDHWSVLAERSKHERDS